MFAITPVISYFWATVCTIQPYLPGLMLMMTYTLGGHFITFAGSWVSARAYSINCVGEGFIGLARSYWTMGSVSCTGLLFAHASLLAIAAGCLLSTMFVFVWLGYHTFKKILYPVVRDIRRELCTI